MFLHFLWFIGGENQLEKKCLMLIIIISEQAQVLLEELLDLPSSSAHCSLCWIPVPSLCSCEFFFKLAQDEVEETLEQEVVEELVTTLLDGDNRWLATSRNKRATSLLWYKFKF